MLPEKAARDCAKKLREIFDGIEVEGSNIYYEGHLLVSRGWIFGGENTLPEPVLFVEFINEAKIIVSLDREFLEDADTHLLTYAIVTIVGWETIGKAGDATIYLDSEGVSIEIGDSKHSWLALKFPYICPCMDIRSYKVEVCLYREGGLKVETVGEFALTELETLRKIVALYLL
jgi:hypothetical protein